MLKAYILSLYMTNISYNRLQIGNNNYLKKGNRVSITLFDP